MKNLLKKIVILSVLAFTISCSKDGDENASNNVPNTLIFKGNPITFNGLSVDDSALNSTSEYIFTTSSGLSMVFYCKYLNVVGPDPRQESADGIVTYSADAVNYSPVNNYPELSVRGYINYDNLQYFSNSGQVKIKRNDTGNQTFEFVNFKVKVGTEEQLLNGTINLPKS